MLYLLQLETILDQGRDHAAHLHNELNSWCDPPAHGQVNLTTDLFLCAPPTKGVFPWVGFVGVELRDVSEWHDNFTQEDIMAQPLPPKHSHL